MLLAPATAMTVPPHVVLERGVGATTTPGGRLSVTATPVMPELSALLSVTVSVVDLPKDLLLVGPKDLLISRGLAITFRLAEALPELVTPSDVVKPEMLFG